MNSRASLSNNWRVKSDAPPQHDDSTAESSRDLHGWSFQQQANFKVGEKHNRTNEADLRKIRGEDDPRTLQAIAVGRRLYVGNMPYMAKTGDVEALFEDDAYKMYACPLRARLMLLMWGTKRAHKHVH